MGTYQTVRRLEASSGEETRMLSRPEDSVELGKEASLGGRTLTWKGNQGYQGLPSEKFRRKIHNLSLSEEAETVKILKSWKGNVSMVCFIR